MERANHRSQEAIFYGQQQQHSEIGKGSKNLWLLVTMLGGTFMLIPPPQSVQGFFSSVI